ncbi:MAG: CoA transferase [Candidatus Rokubacteria bacterium]|nr:CoA transferase [Candidatus Rokubacteria bacterium]
MPAVSGALSSLTVVDLTTVRSGPTGTKILADFGADVVRIERPGDAGRDRVFFDQADLHRNKRSPRSATTRRRSTGWPPRE